MNHTLKLSFLIIISLLLSSNVHSVTISQCILPDGSIEFTNQGCSKSNRLHSRRMFSNDLSRSDVKIIKKKSRKQKPFKQAAFVQLQEKLLGAKDSTEMEQYARSITRKVNTSAQQGKLTAAYNMIAATYVKLSKYLKKKHWEGQSINEHTVKIRTLFEEILITQSTTSSSAEFLQVIEDAWQNYQSNS